MTKSESTVEIFREGAWHRAATLSVLGADRCRFEYLPEYVFSSVDPWPVALRMPLGFEPDTLIDGPTGREFDRTPPAFVYDLVPQGQGRRHLLRELKLADSEQLIMPLVVAGAFNPIGCLRLDTALAFFREHERKNPDPSASQGFTLRDIALRRGAFVDHLSLHAMLASGTTGVQGVAPKFLLTTDADGNWFADMAVPDEKAHQHWLLKLPRGKSDADRAVLRNEAAYLRVASACGLRTHEAPMLEGEMLFVRRFDRLASNGQVLRLHQESLASIAGLTGFGVPVRQQTLLAELQSVATHPLAETIEFLKRDVLNLALRNTDNHARNTAVQRLPDGTIQLTPVFDFAPMFLDPEIVPRACHWRDGSGTRQDAWSEIVESLALDDADRSAVVRALIAFADTVASLPRIAQDCGVEPAVIEQCLSAIEAQVSQLATLERLSG